MTETAIATATLVTYGLAAAGHAVFGVRLWFGERRSTSAQWMGAATLASVVWAAATIAVVTWPSTRTWIVAVVCDTARYAVWFAFLASLLRGSPAIAEPSSARSLPIWFVLIAAALLIAKIALIDQSPFVPHAADTTVLAINGASLGLAVVGLAMVEQLMRRAQPKARWALRPLCIGLAGLFAFDLFMYAEAMMFGHLDVDIWIARGAAAALVIPFLAVATARNPGWAIDMHMSRGVVFHSTAILVSGVFLVMVAAAGYLVRYVGGEWGKTMQTVLVFAALLAVAFAMTSGGVRARLRVFVSKHFYSYRYDYREVWLRFTQSLATQSSVTGVQERCILALADLVESPGGALWLNQEGEFFQVFRCNVPATDAREPASGNLVRFLRRSEWIVDVHEATDDPRRYPDLALPEWVRESPGMWLLIPMIAGGDLLGFLTLQDPRTSVKVDWEVRDLLKTASRQAAGYLNQLMATESLLEARKFDAFNRMSAFVVHDLKNLVAQLSLMLANSQRHRDNPEFQRDMLATVEHVVGRMYKLMLQLRTGAAPAEKPRATNLEGLVRRVSLDKDGGSGRIALDLTPGLYALGHEDRLEHVIGHLIQNALDATVDQGGVQVRLEAAPPNVVLEVIDSGVGMTKEFMRDRLFKPFQTSKPGGLGIGVYESQQYIAALGGQLVIDSKPGGGTRVRVVLPGGDDSAKVRIDRKAVA